MNVLAMLFTMTLGALTLAQTAPISPPAAPTAAAPLSPDTLNTGPCMDSTRAVPQVLQAPIVNATQIVRIDKLVSTASNMQNETIGFLYTLQDGSTWLGQRSADYMSPAGARAINRVLASTHMPDQTVSAFPPTMKYGVATKYQQFFKVQIPATALDPLQVQLVSCVAWPAGRALPDPSM